MDPLVEFALSLKAVHREIQRQMNDVMRPLGITSPQAEVISVLGQSAPLSLRELGQVLIAEAGHPSRLVDRLVDAELVERRAAEDDRRRVELSLTRQGRALERKIHQANDALLENARAQYGDLDFEPAIELLRRMLAGTPGGETVARRQQLEHRAAAHAS